MRKPKLSSLLSTTSGMALVIGTSVLVLVAFAMALVGPDHLARASAAMKVDQTSNSPSATAGATASASASASASSRDTADSETTLAGADTSSASATSNASAAVASAVESIVSADDGHVSVAVEDQSRGTTAGYNVGDDYVTASIIKLDILETLLYDDQKNGTSPSSSQRTLITEMIKQSDNQAALDLYDDEGGASAVTAADTVFGLTDTDVDEDAFGDTTTTVTDQIRLLRQAFTDDSVLTSANREYIQSLMSGVESDQRWGVSSAADDSSSSATDYMLKNGWLPRSATGLWEINSIGEVTHDGREYLVAVLSSDNESMDDGVDVIEKAAKAAVDALD